MTDIYVYRHGWDTDSLGSETVMLFPSRQKAFNHMEHEIGKFFNCSIEDLIKKYENNTDAVVEPNYVEIPYGKDTVFYIIEKKSVAA